MENSYLTFFWHGGCTGFELRALYLPGRQVYHMNHAPSPFLLHSCILGPFQIPQKEKAILSDCSIREQTTLGDPDSLAKINRPRFGKASANRLESGEETSLWEMALLRGNKRTSLRGDEGMDL
jgi:hypothetical protein